MRNHQRDVTIALCSVVAGIMLTAGTLLANNSTFGASALSDLFAMRWEVTPTGVMERSDALRRPGSTSFTKPAAASASAASASSSSAVPAVPVATECEVASDIAAAFTAAINRHVPRDFEFKTIRDGLLYAAEKVVTDYCAVSSSSSSTSAPQAVTPVDNQCEQYGVRSARYTTCKIEENAGRPYPIPSKESRI
ncbi:MAG: hypothetical protein WCV62_04105 [Candidatus Peribacteraceae bacterium]|jgi:hypothetical protein